LLTYLSYGSALTASFSSVRNLYTGHSASDSAVRIFGTAVRSGFLARLKLCLDLGDALYCINPSDGVLKERFLISIFFALLNIYHVTMKVTGGTHIKISYCHPNWIRFRFVIRFYKTSLSDFDMLHVDTRGNGNGSSSGKFNWLSTANQMSFKL